MNESSVAYFNLLSVKQDQLIRAQLHRADGSLDKACAVFSVLDNLSFSLTTKLNNIFILSRTLLEIWREGTGTKLSGERKAET